jgi:hypothetical protein
MSSLIYQVRLAASKAFEFGSLLGLSGEMVWDGKSLQVIAAERGREEELMTGGYRVKKEVSLQVASADIQGLAQLARVLYQGENWLVKSLKNGPHGYTKILLTKDVL